MKRRCISKSAIQNLKKSTPAFILRFLGFFLGVGVVLGISIGVYYSAPPEFIYDANFDWNYVPDGEPFYPTNTSYNIRLDVHSHTTFSDGKLSPEDNLKWHISNGYNAVVVSDHNTLGGALEARRLARSKYDDKIKVLIGVEWTTCRCHLNFVFPPETEFGDSKMFKPDSVFPSDSDIEAIITRVHALNGLVIANHIPWSSRSLPLNTLPTRINFLQWGVDFIGVVNNYDFDFQSAAFCYKNDFRISPITSSDLHSPDQLAYGWTLIQSNFTESGIFSALKNGRRGNSNNFNFIYDAVGSSSKGGVSGERNPLYDFLFPMVWLGGVVSRLYEQREATYDFNGGWCSDHRAQPLYSRIASLTALIFGAFSFYELFALLLRCFRDAISKRRARKERMEVARSWNLAEFSTLPGADMDDDDFLS